MRKTLQFVRLAAAVGLLPVMLVQQSFAWGADGHSIINRVAAAALSADVPEFLRSPAALDGVLLGFPRSAGAGDEREFSGRERVRGLSPAEPELDAAQAPEHFIDL